MAEKMGFKVQIRQFHQNFFGSIVDIVIEVKDAVGRGMGYKDVCIVRNTGIIPALAVGDAVAHKHGDAVKLHTFDFYARIAQVMHVVIEPVDVGSIETFVVIAADEYLVAIREVAVPVEKINGFRFAAGHAEVTGMYYNIGLGQIPKASMATVGVGKMKNTKSIVHNTKITVFYRSRKPALSIAPVSDVLFKDFKQQMEHAARAFVGIHVDGRTVDQVAAELHSVGVVFAAGYNYLFCKKLLLANLP